MIKLPEDYKSAYADLMAAKDKLRAVDTSLPEYRDYVNADKMRDAKLAVYFATKEALPEYREVMRLAEVLSIAYKKIIWGTAKETP
jgi:hypothetical protein